MNILLLTHIYPPAVDGGSKLIAKIGQYLESQGHQTLVVSSNCYSSDDFSHTYQSNLKSSPSIIRLPVVTLFHRPLKLLSRLFPNLRILSKGPIFFYISLRKILAFKPELIIAGPLPTTIILYASFLAKLLGAKLLIIPCYHPSDPDFQNSFIKKSLSAADYIVTFTHTEKKLLRRFSSAKIVVNPLGVDPEFILNSSKITFPKDPNILFIANFAAHKRFELLLDAFYQLHQIYPRLTLTALGQKTLYWPKIQTKLDSLPIKVKFIFNPTQKEIQQSIDRSTLLCLPSIQESFGLVFIESLARGKPVLGANTPQTTEVIKLIHGGLTFETDQLPDLIAKIKLFIDHPLETQKIGLTGYHYVKSHLTWAKIGQALWSKIS